VHVENGDPFPSADDCVPKAGAPVLSIDRILVTMLLRIRREHAATITPITAECVELGNLADESVLTGFVHFNYLQWKKRGPPHIGVL
jgi:hypothetical protein